MKYVVIMETGMWKIDYPFNLWVIIHNGICYWYNRICYGYNRMTSVIQLYVLVSSTREFIPPCNGYAILEG